MFNHIAYATTAAECDSAMDELRKFKRELAVWVERNDPQHWAQSKFKKEMWGKLNNNPIESWNNWMRKSRVMSIPWLVLGHLQKVGLKLDKRKAEIQKWANNVGDRIEKKLSKELANADSLIVVQAYNRVSGEFSVQLNNSRRLVVMLSKGECSCRWWQIKGFPCRHDMEVIRKEKKWVYDYVNVCYKSATQQMCYMNTVHLMETHDMTTADDRTGCVTGGEGWMTISIGAFCLLSIHESAADQNQLGGNHRRKECAQTDVRSAMSLGTRGTHVGTPGLTLLQIMKGILSQ